MNESPIARLADYQPPAWRVRHVDIAFDLDLDASEVDCTLSLEPDPDQPPAELVLDGEDLELLAIQLDGVPLDADGYGHANGRLVIPAARAACRLRTRVRIHPSRNTRLEGLYASRGLLLTQCEAEG
ncbi:MAG: aminopeptidase N, partial [Gammaproteobacteria bacterium HGW-Gammaproteobacteria-5]